jgi:endonuclease/exonuclease/phosphatase family metal-dependent hydrolase/uncharacterized protein YraI
MQKIVSIVLTIMLVILLVSCSSSEEPAEYVVPPEDLPVYSVSNPSESSTAPLVTSVPTTEPDSDQTPDPDPNPEPSSSQAAVPAGIVKNSGEILGDGVAFRDGPSVEAALIERLDKGTFVKIVKTNIDAQWHQVEYNGKLGYVHRVYISLDASLDGYKLDFVGTIINVQNDVNVRSEPTTQSEIIGVASKGSNLTILPQDIYIEDWYQVEFEGETAYIHADYLDVTAKVDDTQLKDLTINGGSAYPAFSPNEYGYVVKATGSQVTISAKANDGVDVNINGTGESSLTIDIPSVGMRTVRIAVGADIRYSVYISRNVLTVGTWNIKRGAGNLLMQGRLVYDQQPDIMGIQEAFENLGASNIIDNLASLKTKDMSFNWLSATINYSSGAKYGNGIICRYKLRDIEVFPLYSGGSEKRLLQKAVIRIGDKVVSLYNTHLTHNSVSIRAKQFAQIVQILDSDENEYIILTGDFNADISEISVFSDYTVVNTAETKYYDYSKNIIDINDIDNIVVSNNIDVINSRIVITKLSDHYPVFAYLVLN